MKKTLFLAVLTSSLYGSAMAQKNEKSISGGALFSLPFRNGDPIGYVNNGWGVEVNGFHKFTNRSAITVQTGIGDLESRYYGDHWTFYWVKAGYRYQFGASGFYLNGLLGPEFDLDIGDPLMTYTAGGGKRFHFKNNRFIEAGIEYVGGNTEPRVNLVVTYGLSWQRKR